MGFAALNREYCGVSGSQPTCHEQATLPLPRPVGACLGRCQHGGQEGRPARGGCCVAWRPLPSVVSGGWGPGGMTRQASTATSIVWSLA